MFSLVLGLNTKSKKVNTHTHNSRNDDVASQPTTLQDYTEVQVQNTATTAERQLQSMCLSCTRWRRCVDLE